MVQFISLEKQIYFGVRGDASRPHCLCFKETFRWTLWKLGTNPAMMLAQFSFNEDDDGRVTIEGFYDDDNPIRSIGEISFIKCAFC
jgi:hypothetical protein